MAEQSFLSYIEFDWADELGDRWYRSKERKGNYPFSSYMMNKKWTLEEEMNLHMMRFQQVTVSSIQFSIQVFDYPGWIGLPRSSF